MYILASHTTSLQAVHTRPRGTKECNNNRQLRYSFVDKFLRIPDMVDGT